jgi:hypothetical protein
LVDHGWPATVPQKTVCPPVVLDTVPVRVPDVVAPEVVVAEPVVDRADALVAPPPLAPPQATMTGASAKSPATADSTFGWSEPSNLAASGPAG